MILMSLYPSSPLLSVAKPACCSRSFWVAEPLPPPSLRQELQYLRTFMSLDLPMDTPCAEPSRRYDGFFFSRSPEHTFLADGYPEAKIEHFTQGASACLTAQIMATTLCAIDSHRVLIIPLHQGHHWALPPRRLLVRRSRGIFRICPSGSSGSDLGASRVGTGHYFRRYSLARSAWLPVVACCGVSIASPGGPSASLRRTGTLIRPITYTIPCLSFDLLVAAYIAIAY
jgi:hypothetical protein